MVEGEQKNNSAGDGFPEFCLSSADISLNLYTILLVSLI